MEFYIKVFMWVNALNALARVVLLVIADYGNNGRVSHTTKSTEAFALVGGILVVFWAFTLVY